MRITVGPRQRVVLLNKTVYKTPMGLKSITINYLQNTKFFKGRSSPDPPSRSHRRVCVGETTTNTNGIRRGRRKPRQNN